MAPGCFSVINKKQGDEESSSHQQLTSSSSDNKIESAQQSVVHYQIPLPSSNPPSQMSYVSSSSAILAPLTTASFIIPLTKSDQCSPEDSHDDDSDSDDDDDDSSSESSDSSSSSSSDSEDDDADQDDDDDDQEETRSDVLKSEKTRLKPMAKIRLSKNFYDTVDSFEILEQTILKQKRLSRLKNTDLRKKILLKRTFDLVCEIMDRENGFDDLNDDAKPPTIESKQPQLLQQAPTSPAELHIVQLDQQPPMPPVTITTSPQVSSIASDTTNTELNDIIYLNLINQSDLIDALNESTVIVDSNNNNSNISNKKRRFSSDEEDDDDDEEEDEEYYEYEYEDDYYSKNKNILILNKHQDKENLENQSSQLASSQPMDYSITTASAASTCLFYSDAERVAERTKLNHNSSNGHKRTRFS